MAKVLLIMCQGVDRIGDEQGLASIASYLRNNNHEVLMRSMKKNIGIESHMKEFIPAVIGISVYHDDLNFAYDIAKYYKELLPAAYIVLGGYSATYYYYEILKACKEIDYIMRGEGEECWRILCDSIDNGDSIEVIGSLVFRDPTGDICVNPVLEPIKDLNNLDFTSKDILVSKSINMAHLSTTRGCLGNCSFCYSHKFFDPSGKTRWRGKSPELVVREVVSLFNIYGISRVYFDDASFEDSLDGPKRMEIIADLLIKENIPVTFTVFFRASIHKKLSESLLGKLKTAGLSNSFIGVESFNQKELKIFNKGARVADNENSIIFLRKHQIGVAIGFINFTPYSDIDTLTQNAKLLHKHRFFGSFWFTNKLRAYKGTDIHDRIKADGLFLEEDETNYYCYKYENTYIDVFEKYLTNKFDRMSVESDFSLPMIGWDGYVNHSQYIAHYRNLFQKLGLYFEEYIEELNKNYLSFIDKHNNLCYSWYCELLNLLKNGWDESKAETITNSYHLLKESRALAGMLKKNLLNFHYKLLKHNRELSKYFVGSDIK